MLNFFKNVGWVFAWPFMLIWCLIEYRSCVIAGRRYKKDPTSSKQEERYEKIKKLVKHYLYLKHIKVRLTKKEKIENKPMLFVANHKANIDGLVVLYTALNQDIPYVTFVAKIELQGTKIGNILDLLDVIYVDRQDLRKVPEVIDNMVKTLQSKTSICLFPEGTRVHGDDFGEFKPTLFEAAYRTHFSIQPIVIYNTDGLLDKNYKSNRVDKVIDVSYLPVINSREFVNINRNLFVPKVRETMLAEYNRLKRDHTKNTKE